MVRLVANLVLMRAAVRTATCTSIHLLIPALKVPKTNKNNNLALDKDLMDEE